MRTGARTLVLGAVLVVWWVGSGFAQEPTVDDLLRELNQVLHDNAYVDHDGKHTESRVALRRGGTLVIQVVKSDDVGEVSNIYATDIHTINLNHIQEHHRGTHTVLMIGCQGDVAYTLRNVQRAGGVTEWNLPARGSVPLEFQTDGALARDVRQSVVRLITEARKDPRYQ